MATAIELALQRAQQEREARLRSTVAQWSSDDKVHTDPPLPPTAPAASPAPDYWPLLHADKPPATPEATKENEVAQEFNHQTNETVPPLSAPPSEAPARPKRHHILILPNPQEVGVTEACQMAVRDNPGTTRRELMAALAEAGYKAGSVSSTFGMMVIQKIIKVDADGRTWPRYKRHRKLISHAQWVKEHPEYTPMRNRPGGGKKAARRQARSASPHAPTRVAAAYANCVRWAREKGRPLPVWDEWLAEYRKKHAVTNHEAAVAKEAVKQAKSPHKEAVAKARRAPTSRLMKQAAATLDSAPRRTDPTGPSVRGMTPQQIVDELSLAQARDLLKLLQDAFSA